MKIEYNGDLAIVNVVSASPDSKMVFCASQRDLMWTGLDCDTDKELFADPAPIPKTK